jgi:hypothetical protein
MIVINQRLAISIENILLFYMEKNVIRNKITGFLFALVLFYI